MSVYKVKPQLTGKGTEIYPVVINKSDDDIYSEAESALLGGKPILWYEDVNTCYYIDTITKSGTDIVLTKGGKTITIEADGDITEIGDIQVESFTPFTHTYNLSGDSAMGVFFSITIQLLLDNDTELDTMAKLFEKIGNKRIMCVGTSINGDNTYHVIDCEIGTAPNPSGYVVQLRYMKNDGTLDTIYQGTNNLRLVKDSII